MPYAHVDKTDTQTQVIISVRDRDDAVIVVIDFYNLTVKEQVLEMVGTQILFAAYIDAKEGKTPLQLDAICPIQNCITKYDNYNEFLDQRSISTIFSVSYFFHSCIVIY